MTVGEVDVAVYDAYFAREPPLEAFCDLGGECDLGDQYQRLEVACDTVFDERKVDFSLPTSGNPVQQKWCVGVCCNVCGYLCNNRLLRYSERNRGARLGQRWFCTHQNALCNEVFERGVAAE